MPVSTCTFALAFCFLAAVATGSDVAVVRGTLTEKLDPDREGRGIKTYLGNVTHCLDEAAVPYDLLTDEDVEAGKLTGYRFALFPYNPQRTDKWTEAVLNHIEGGGKVFLFCSVDPKIAERLGVKVESYFREKARGDLAVIKFQPGVVDGVPDSVRQMSWSTQVVSPIGGARVLATWLNEKGNDAGLPAVIVSGAGVFMGHVLLDDDLPKKSTFIFACIAHFLPDLWAQAAERGVERVGKFASFASLDDLKKRIEAEKQEGAVPERALQRLAEAEEKKKLAQSLAEQKKYEESIAAAAEARNAALEVYDYLVPNRDGECRGVWMPSKLWTTWDEAMKNLKENGFNAAFPVMCSGYSANYASEILPPSQIMTESGDQLKQCLEAARKYGIEVHVWRVNWRASGLTKEQAETLASEKRLQVGVEGEKEDAHGGAWLCPSHPANRKLEIDAMLEIVRKYHPDGIHFDYIRYPGDRFCYCDGCRERFEAAIGRKIADWPKDVRRGGDLFEKFDDWRRDQITQTVAAVSEQARKIDPKVKISAAVFRDWKVHRQAVGQDWKLWCEKGYLDFVCPMDYTDDPKRFERDVAEQVDWVAGAVPLYPGIGAFSSASRFRDPSALLEQIEIARGLGADGFLIFHYNEDLATRFLPALRLRATSKDTFLPHDAPRVGFKFPDPLIPTRPRSYAVGPEIKVDMTFAKDVMGRVEYEKADGRSIASLDAVLAEDTRERTVRIAVPEGRSRIAVYGQTSGRNGKPAHYVRRSAPIVGLTEGEIDDYELRSGPPRVPPGEGIRVGVVDGGFGSTTILSALKLEANMRVFPMYNFIPESLAACDVIVLPQLKDPSRLDESVRKRLREFVLQGGGLVVTHDAVGYRNHVAIVPEVGAKGAAHPKEIECRIAAEHPITKGLEAGAIFKHSYVDHVLVEPGKSGTVIVADPGGGAIVVAGVTGAGRYVANGMATGLGPKNEDVPLDGAEKQLFVNTVRWVAGD